VRVVGAEDNSRITFQSTAFRRVTVSGEHQLAIVDDEPHRSDQRPPVRGDEPQHPGAGAFRQERDDPV
jgi:hypothetical protein